MTPVKMIRTEDGKTGDIHPDEVENMRLHGWQVADQDGEPSEADDHDNIAKLRAEYQDLIGKRPFPGWDAAELQRRIDANLAG